MRKVVVLHTEMREITRRIEETAARPSSMPQEDCEEEGRTHAQNPLSHRPFERAAAI